MEPFIALTDKAWFDFLHSRSTSSVVDEVNFWSPQSIEPMKRIETGERIFFRLKTPYSAIAGYGFFASFRVLALDLAWEVFGWKNGDPSKLSFLQRIGQYRNVDLFEHGARRGPLGCTILRSACFWPRERWISWGREMEWAPNIVRGKTERDARRIGLLLNAIEADVPEDLRAEPFVLADIDGRSIVLRTQIAREDQGSFRTRVLEAYDGRCAITGEHTEPVLDAAHIQPYLGPRSNHLQNGLLMTKEFHALFDQGYVTVTPDLDKRPLDGTT